MINVTFRLAGPLIKLYLHISLVLKKDYPMIVVTIIVPLEIYLNAVIS